MKRRELSAALLASALGGAARAANAENAATDPVATPRFPQTAAESKGKAMPLNPMFPPLDARRYGEIDTTGLNDSTAALQTAINVAAVDGGIVQLPPGKIAFTALRMLANVTIQGHGKAATVLTTNTGGDGISMKLPINASTNARTNVRDLSIVCTNAANVGGGYVDVGGTFVALSHVRISGFKYNVIFDQTELGDIDYCDLENSLVAALWLVNGSDHTPGALKGYTNRISVLRSQFNSANGGTAVIDDGGAAHVFTANNFNSFTHHFQIAGTRTVTLEGNEFESAAGHNIVFRNETFNKRTPVGANEVVTLSSNFISPAKGFAAAEVAPNSVNSLALISNRLITSAAAIINASNINTVFAYGNMDSNTGSIFDGVAANHFETGTAKGAVIVKDGISLTGPLAIQGQATTGSQSASWTAPTNKPGQSPGAIARWIPVTLDGKIYYVPAWT